MLVTRQGQKARVLQIPPITGQYLTRLSYIQTGMPLEQVCLANGEKDTRHQIFPVVTCETIFKAHRQVFLAQENTRAKTPVESNPASGNHSWKP